MKYPGIFLFMNPTPENAEDFERMWKLRQIIAMLDSLYALSDTVSLPLDEMREIVEMAAEIRDPELFDRFVVEIARSVDEIRQRAEEAEKRLVKEGRKFSETVETFATEKSGTELLQTLA